MSCLLRKMNDYQMLIEFVRNDGFVIGGFTESAHDLYLYCIEMGYEELVKGFVLINDDQYKSFRQDSIHGKKYFSFNEYLQAPVSRNIYIPEAEYYVKDVVFPRFQNSNGDFKVLFCGDFFKGCSVQFHFGKYAQKICRYYMVEDNHDQPDVVSVVNEKRQKYIYTLKTYRAVIPNVNLFGEPHALEIQHKKELGDYINFEDAVYDEQSDKKCRIYMSQSDVDLKISDTYNSPFVIPVHAGAALSNQDICYIRDDEGENISVRNRDYCEMTVAFWAWKNDSDSDYIGLCHYRRRYKTNKSVLCHLMNQEFDVITTIPKILDNGLYSEIVSENAFIDTVTWELLGKALEKYDSGIYESWEKAGALHFLIPYNMSIMTRKLFDEYCNLLFKILATIDKFYLDKGIQRNNRYLGYVSEVFLSLYLSTYKEKYKKAYLPMKFLL